MRRSIQAVVFFVCVSGGFCADLPSSGNSGGTEFPIAGSYTGRAISERKSLNVTINGVKASQFGKQPSMLTGGDRFVVYFDNDGKQGADYALFVYCDTWTLRQPITENVGHYVEEIAHGKTEWFDGGVSGCRIHLPRDVFPDSILKIWSIDPAKAKGSSKQR